MSVHWLTAVPAGHGSLRADLWSVMEPVYKQILEHPFVTGLTDGTLPMECFAHYVRQDSHYLRDYSRALALVAAKAPDESITAMFAAHAHQAIEVEASLHAGFAADLAVDYPEAFGQPVCPTTLAYTSYVLRVCSQGDFVQGLAAVLPCYWIYAEVGNALLAASSPQPLYARWIETYGGEEFAAVVAAVLDVVDEVGASIGAAQLDLMREHVLTTSKYEWMFWDAGWRGETWPI
jgi:thiaminase (transcriptional activator TenA)